MPAISRNRNKARRRAWTIAARASQHGLERVFTGYFSRPAWAYSEGHFETATAPNDRLSRIVLHRILVDRWNGGASTIEQRRNMFRAIASWRNDPKLG
jgi:hypothetical protein